MSTWEGLRLNCLFLKCPCFFLNVSGVLGLGIGTIRDCSTIMVGQYYKRQREIVEIFVVAGSGFGLLVMSFLLEKLIESVGWR